MTFETPDDVLEHFGVKGMKWGVRKNRASGSSGRGDKKTSKKRRAVQIAIAAGVVATGAVLAHRSGVRVSSLRDVPSSRFMSPVRNPLIVSPPRLGSRVSSPRLGSPLSGPVTVANGRWAAQQVLQRIGNERW